MENGNEFKEWDVNEAKVEEAVRRIVAAADPLKVILFGSRARGDFRTDSDVDLAVIVDGAEEDARRRVPYDVLRGLRLEANLIVVSESKYDRFRPWPNNVFRSIDREGVVLYDRRNPQSTGRDALPIGGGGRINASIPAS